MDLYISLTVPIGITLKNLGGQSNAGPSAHSPDRKTKIRVHVRGTDNGLWQAWSNDGSTFYGFNNLGGVLKSGPGATSTGSQNDQAFVIGQDDKVWRRNWTGSWSSWHKPFENKAYKGISAVAPLAGYSIHLFYVNNDNTIKYSSTSGYLPLIWKHTKIPANSADKPDAVNYGTSNYEVFYKGNDGKLHVLYKQSNQWVDGIVSIPSSILPKSAPSATAFNNKLHVFFTKK